jgi:DNA-directed RNA polymerase sigma subunit (sigma70/sigma32)
MRLIVSLNKLHRVTRLLVLQHGREPGIEDVVLGMDMPAEKARRSQAASKAAIFLATHVGDEDEPEPGDFLPDARSGMNRRAFSVS